jgi:hypothetical protein
MSSASEKILLCKLYEKTGVRSGRRYLYGYLGSARLVAFLDEDAELRYGATAVFNVFVQAAEERKSEGDAGAGDRPSREPPQRQSQPPSDEPLPDPVPFNDDGSSLWEDDR